MKDTIPAFTTFSSTTKAISEYFVQGGSGHTAAILGLSLHQVHQRKETSVPFEE